MLYNHANILIISQTINPYKWGVNQINFNYIMRLYNQKKCYIFAL